MTGTPASFRPDPLTAISFFEVLNNNEGVLQFPVAAEGITGAAVPTGPAVPPGTKFVVRLEGRLSYRSERQELQQIGDDPLAVRDTIVGFFADTKGRVNAEIVSRRSHQLNCADNICLLRFIAQDFGVVLCPSAGHTSSPYT